jgi:hypothetical protein
MILFDKGPIAGLIVFGIDLKLIIFGFLIFAAIVFVVYKMLKRK